MDENIADFLGLQNVLKAYRKYVEKYGKEKSLVDFESVSHEKLLTMAFATVSDYNIMVNYYYFFHKLSKYRLPEKNHYLCAMWEVNFLKVY